MPVILAVDTTHEHGSVALLRGCETLEEIALCEPSGFAHVIYRVLAELMGRHGVKPEAIDCFAAASGPGSFTGVRVGLACVKGLAEAARKPAVAVSNLQALATFGTAPLRAAVLDARRGEIYGAVYDDAGRLVMPEVVASAAAWLETLPPDVQFAGFDLERLLAGTRFARAPRVEAPSAIASAVGKLAAERFARGEAGDPAGIDANYVRRSDAELFWKEQ